jgi:hypothetical protein
MCISMAFEQGTAVTVVIRALGGIAWSMDGYGPKTAIRDNVLERAKIVKTSQPGRISLQGFLFLYCCAKSCHVTR